MANLTLERRLKAFVPKSAARYDSAANAGALYHRIRRHNDSKERDELSCEAGRAMLGRVESVVEGGGGIGLREGGERMAVDLGSEVASLIGRGSELKVEHERQQMSRAKLTSGKDTSDTAVHAPYFPPEDRCHIVCKYYSPFATPASNSPNSSKLPPQVLTYLRMCLTPNLQIHDSPHIVLPLFVSSSYSDLGCPLILVDRFSAFCVIYFASTLTKLVARSGFSQKCKRLKLTSGASDRRSSRGMFSRRQAREAEGLRVSFSRTPPALTLPSPRRHIKTHHHLFYLHIHLLINEKDMVALGMHVDCGVGVYVEAEPEVVGDGVGEGWGGLCVHFGLERWRLREPPLEFTTPPSSRPANRTAHAHQARLAPAVPFGVHGIRRVIRLLRMWFHRVDRYRRDDVLESDGRFHGVAFAFAAAHVVVVVTLVCIGVDSVFSSLTWKHGLRLTMQQKEHPSVA
ncbi:hypothetical protein R3P38DRAFT_2801053 [Favolaschia claudopus]|uniref:Uncharacterized protein n=1 Tax=Favolaschia claudopus TaxID=2862362 RepID=A0AAV9ZVP9_9AGAR